MRLCIIIRDSNKNGKSIEGIFSSLISNFSKFYGLEVLYFEYNNTKSLISNIISIQKINADVYHISGDVNWLTIFLINKNVINTIHDIGSYYQYRFLKKFLYKLFWIQFPVLFSKSVTVVSEFTKNEILKIINTNKLVIIPNPVNPIFKFYQLNFSKNNPTILIIGTQKHKNIETIIKSIISLDVNLCIIGKLNENQLFLLKKFSIRYVCYNDLNINEVYDCYKKSDIVVFASFHEGFGMPIIEANAVGRPLILSNKCSMPIIAGESALLFDPNNVVELRNHIVELINNDFLRKNLINKGLLNSLNYKIDIIANMYYKLYLKYEN